jgi:heterokaryon incompatibility protein (HET)
MSLGENPSVLASVLDQDYLPYIGSDVEQRNNVDKIYHRLYPDEIRLVELAQGQPLDAISCTLHHTHFAFGHEYEELSRRTALPEYKALSYTWGPPAFTKQILLDSQPFLVTPNLESALKRLRHHRVPQVFWIDAICINQLDIVERAHQVSKMRNIYSMAEEVIVYLGEAESWLPGLAYEDSRILTKSQPDAIEDQKLHVPHEHYSLVKQRKQPNYDVNIFHLIRSLSPDIKLSQTDPFDNVSSDIFDPEYQWMLCAALKLLLQCQWWNRMWVVQEVVVAKKVTIAYGPMKDSLEILGDASRFYSQRKYSHPFNSYPREHLRVLDKFAQTVGDIQRLRQTWISKGEASLLPLLRQFSGRGVSDDRDRVYALLGLAKEGVITPNYSLGVDDVFQDAVLAALRETGTLDVLSRDLGRRNRRELPSWVADWSVTYDSTDRAQTELELKFQATLGTTIRLHPGVRNRMGSNETFQSYLLDKGYNPQKVPLDKLPELIQAFDDIQSKVVSEVFYSGNYLYMPAKKMDQINWISEPTGRTTLYANTSSLISSWIQSGPFSNERLRLALFRTLCADSVFRGSLSQDESTHGILDSRTAAFKNLELPQDGEVAEWLWERLKESYPSLQGRMPADLDQSIETAIARRRLFVTKTEIVGLGPLSMESGDYIHLLLGAKTPFVLRNVLAKIKDFEPAKCFMVVGSCYAQGLMNGEAMRSWKNRLYRMPSSIKGSRYLKKVARAVGVNKVPTVEIVGGRGIWPREYICLL